MQTIKKTWNRGLLGKLTFPYDAARTLVSEYCY